MWEQKNKILEDLALEMSNLGIKQGTAEYNSLLLEKRVLKCQSMRGVSSCGGCNFVEYCGLIKEYLADVKYKNK